MAYVLSSISGNLISAASAGYASISNSAYYDGTGRFISALPDSATVSAIASAYAESAASSKQDTLTFGYDGTSISSIDGSSIAGGGGGGGVVTSLQYYTSGSTSTGTGTAIGFANAGNSTGSINYYTLDFGEYDPSCITALKYSQILITADKNADFMTALPLVSSDLSAFTVYKSVADTADFSSVPDSAKSYVGRLSTNTSDLGTAVRFNLTGNDFSSIKTGEENVLVLAYRYMFDHWGTLPVTGTTGSFVFNYENSSGYSAVSGVNELGLYFDTSNCYSTSNPSGFISNADLSNYATTAYVDSSVSGKLDATASSQFLTSTAGLVGTGDLTAYAYESSNSAKLDTTAFSDVSGTFLTAVPAGYATTADISGFAYESAVSGWTAKQDALTFGYDASNNISSIDGSAIGGQGGGIDSATCSAIASAYAESAASGKQDSLAFGYDASNNISSINGSGIGGGGGSVVFDGSSNKISSINGSALQAQLLSSTRITIGIASDPGLYLTGSQGTAYYKANEMIINRTGYGEQVKFNLGSAGTQVYGSATGQRGAFISMFNGNHSAFLGAKSGEDGMLVLDGVSANSADMTAWNTIYSVSSNYIPTSQSSNYMQSTAVQTAYASASASQATAQNVLYILLPDGEDDPLGFED